MKRLRRRLFSALAAMSLFLCLLAVTLWVRDRPFLWAWGWTTSTPATPTTPAVHNSWFIIAQGDGLNVAHVLVRDFPGRVYPTTRPPNGYTDWRDFWEGLGIVSGPGGDYIPDWTNRHWGFYDGGWKFKLGAGQLSWGYIRVEYPIFVATTALLPAAYVALGLLRLKRQTTLRRRSMARHCTICGYDLRATPDRCPECGKVPPKPQIPE